GMPDRKDSHVEELFLVGLVAPSERHEIVDRQPDRVDVVAHVAFYELPSEYVEARRHRRMGREYISVFDDIARELIIDVALLHQMACALDAQETGVAFVHVAEHRLLAHRDERTISADPKHHELLN